MMKYTRPRSQERLLKFLHSFNRAMSAQDIFIELRQRNEKMSLATVYRALEALKLSGVIQSRTLANGEALYSSMQQDKHHLTCLQCGESIPIDQCPVHQLENQLQKSHQFKIYYHTLEFFGLCDRCQLIETEASI
jgi:Fur family transcriptional regulator, ferric uptake regulator